VNSQVSQSASPVPHMHHINAFSCGHCLPVAALYVYCTLALVSCQQEKAKRTVPIYLLKVCAQLLDIANVVVSFCG